MRRLAALALLLLFSPFAANAQLITGPGSNRGGGGGGGSSLPTGLGYASPCFTIGSDVANQLVECGSTTTNPLTISSTGSDASAPIKFAPKGPQGFLQLGPDTYGAAGWAGSNVTIEIFNLATTTSSPNAIYIEQYTGDFAGGFSYGVSSLVGTQGVGATQDLTQLVGLAGLVSSTLPVGRSVGAVYGGYFSVGNQDAGSITNLWGVWSRLGNSGGGTVTNAYSFYAVDIGGISSNPYYLWLDDNGVFRIRSDSTFDSVSQAIPSLYNPQFTKYTPGAANFERIILSQWNGNVAEIGTEKGGTGTLRPLRLIGASIQMNAVTNFAASGVQVNGVPGISRDVALCTGVACATTCVLRIASGVITNATGTCPAS